MATCETCKANKVCDHNKYGFENCNNYISADVVEVKYGEWLWNRGCAYGESPYYCSLCIDGGSDNGRDNYCPNCGAKMNGGE